MKLICTYINYINGCETEVEIPHIDVVLEGFWVDKDGEFCHNYIVKKDNYLFVVPSQIKAVLKYGV